MNNLQRKTFEHLKKHLEDPSEFKNFKVFLDTCDIRTVQFLGKVKVGDEWQSWSIEYNRESCFFFFWTPWECTITLGWDEYKESYVDDSVLKDIINYKKEVIRRSKINDKCEKGLTRKKILDVLDSEEE